MAHHHLLSSKNDFGGDFCNYSMFHTLSHIFRAHFDKSSLFNSPPNDGYVMKNINDYRLESSSIPHLVYSPKRTFPRKVSPLMCL